MGRLIEFYRQHRRLFMAQKHQNLKQTERFKDAVILKFLGFCEDRKIFHTKGIKREIAIDFFNSLEIVAKSNETRRKYFLVIREFYNRHFKTNLIKEEILK